MLTGVATESCSSYISVTFSFRKIKYVKYVKIIRVSIPFYENDTPDKNVKRQSNFNTLYNKNDVSHNLSVRNINVIVENHN